MAVDSPTLRRLLAIACGTSAGVHAALVPAHAEIAEAGVLFAASAIVLLVIAIAIERGAGPPVIAAAAAVLTGLIAAYAASRMGALWPLDHREPLDALGVTTKLFEAAGLVFAVCLLQTQRTATKVLSGETKGVHP